jgi:hypothetical protein
MGTRWKAIVLVCLLVCLLCAASAAGATLDERPALVGETIGILHDPAVPRAVIDEAVARWRACRNYGVGFPSFVSGSPGSRTVHVRYDPRQVGDGCCGWFRGDEIRLYRLARDERGEVHSCGSMAHILAHELGHVLGLEDAPDSASPSRSIMSRLSTTGTMSRTVQRDECNAAGHRWITVREWLQGRVQAGDGIAMMWLGVHPLPNPTTRTRLGGGQPPHRVPALAGLAVWPSLVGLAHAQGPVVPSPPRPVTSHGRVRSIQ